MNSKLNNLNLLKELEEQLHEIWNHFEMAENDADAIVSESFADVIRPVLDHMQDGFEAISEAFAQVKDLQRRYQK